MNDYEKERLANIAKNEALLKEIGLTGIKIAKPRSSTPTKRSTPRKKEVSEPVVRRTSSRLSGIPADSEVAKRKAEEQVAAQLEQDRQKRARVAGPISLNAVIENAATWDEAEKIFAEVTKNQVKRDYTTIKTDRAAEDALADARSSMASLSLLTRWEPNEIKITPERIFSLGMHPGDKKLAIGGDKLGHLGIWDIENSRTSPQKDTGEADHDEDDEEEEAEREDPMIHHFKLHSRTITSFSIDPVRGNQLYSSSYDGSIRCLDLVTGKAVETFASPTDQAITSLELVPDGNLMYFSTLDGEVGVKDLRTKQDECEFHQLHDRKIGSLGVHPLQPHIVCTASLDRTMAIWDLKQMRGTRKSSRTPIAQYACQLSVSSAYFNANGSIVATSFDDTLKVFHLAELSTWKDGKVTREIEPDVSVRHNNQTGRWLTVFKAAWQQTPLDGIPKFVVGNMKRMVNVYDYHGNGLVDLENEYISAVPAVAAFHPSRNWVIAGNASGKALFFE